MKKLLFSMVMLCIANLSISQVVFQSDLSAWDTAGNPTDFYGTKTNLASASCTEVTTGAIHGTSFANLVNTSSSSHKRLTTHGITVVPGQKYFIDMWIANVPGDTADLRVSMYDLTNASWTTYTSYQDVVGSTLTKYSDSVVAPAGCTSLEFMISFKGTDALGLGLDSVAIFAPMGPPPPPPSYSAKTIYEIQYTADVSGDSPYEDSLVETTGTVTATHSSGYWIQDSSATWNGVYVYDNTNSPSRGDNVTIKGLVAEYYGLTQIKNIDTLITNSTGNVLPAGLSVNSTTMKNEMNEGVLVVASNAKCVNPAAGRGEWDYSNTPGDTAVVDDMMYLYTPVLGTRYDVTGVIQYSFNEYKLEPRDSLDIVASTIVSIEENSLEFSLYPNPVTTIFTLSGVNLEKAEIYSVNGKLIKTISLNVINNIDVSDLESGAYILRVTSNNKVGITRFIKQ
ncbi:T9SS type A sorting domain-containing protein [Flavobacteriales bacterium]|nr:T9SS type A sorting domain-containing protein [Flavobacteriales bacterium]